MGERGGRGYTAQTRRRYHALCFRRSPAAIKRGGRPSPKRSKFASQIYSAFIRCNTLYLAMQGVCHPFPLDSLKGCVGAEAIPIYCLCILATLRHISTQAHPQLVPHLPYRSRQHSHFWLECFPPQRTSISVATASATSFLSSAVMYL